MTYDDIRKDLSLWTVFLLPLKKDISSGQIRGYPNVLNALIKLDIIIRSLKKILDKQDNKAIRGSYDGRIQLTSATESNPVLLSC